MQYVAQTTEYAQFTDDQLLKEVEELDKQIRTLAGQIEKKIHTPAVPGNEAEIARLRQQKSPLEQKYNQAQREYHERVVRRRSQEASQQEIAQKPKKSPIQLQIERVEVELAKLKEML